MKTILCLIALSLTVAAQQNHSNLKIFYEKVEDRTNVSTKTRDVKGLSITAFFNHPGKSVPSPVEALGLMFESRSEDWKFLHDYDQQLFVLADGQRFKYDRPRTDATILKLRSVYQRNNVKERLIFAIKREDMEQIVNAQKVEMKLGTTTFALGSDTIKDLREIVDAMKPQP